MNSSALGLERLNEKLNITDKLHVIHQEIKQHYPDIGRIAVALYEKERDLLKTFICSCSDGNALPNYQSSLYESPSLVEILNGKIPRVINDLSVFDGLNKQHSKKISDYGYCSSYTYPMFNDGNFVGFVFVNSTKKGAFTPVVVSVLALFIHLISLITIRELDSINVLLGSVCTALDLSHHRDPETGAHLERMSRYSRLIANKLASSHGLDDDYIEYVYRFSPLHDVGKIAIPDKILLKEGKLTDEEMKVMKTHPLRGKEIISRMLNNFGLHSIKYMDVLLNIVEYHHENMNGTGYPYQLIGEEIPLEARIVAVADVFDALTSIRPYKKAWSNDESFAEMKRLSGSKFDVACTNALLSQRDAIEEIQSQFKDEDVV